MRLKNTNHKRFHLLRRTRALKLSGFSGFSAIALLAGAIAIINLNLPSLINIAKADEALVTPTAEACFATTGTETKTITDYYDHENDNSANPACPRDVVIPGMIDGVEVTTIDDAANYWSPSTATSFAHKQLTSVTIPDSVTSIGK